MHFTGGARGKKQPQVWNFWTVSMMTVMVCLFTFTILKFILAVVLFVGEITS